MVQTPAPCFSETVQKIRNWCFGQEICSQMRLDRDTYFQEMQGQDFPLSRSAKKKKKKEKKKSEKRKRKITWRSLKKTQRNLFPKNTKTHCVNDFQMIKRTKLCLSRSPKMILSRNSSSSKSIWVTKNEWLAVYMLFAVSDSRIQTTDWRERVTN